MRALFDHEAHRIHAPAPLMPEGVPMVDETACGASLGTSWCWTAYPPKPMDSIWSGKTHEVHETMQVCAECAPILKAS